MSRRLTVVLAAGGTGGHVFPAVAAAAALRARGHRVVVATDGRGARFGGDVETTRVRAASLAGGAFAKVKGAAALAWGAVQAALLLLRVRADAVVGFGGYPSLPTMAAATLLRRPTLLHEQNAVLGRVNRLLAPRVRCVATAFPEPEGAPKGRAVQVGNPVRQEIADIGVAGFDAPTPDGPIELLIFGGSQGARVLSDVLPAATARLPDALARRLHIVQQCRPEDLDRVAASYRAAGQTAELKSFFDDMPRRFAAAHLVVARAGASTVAELAAAGRPAILIPFAAAMDDHQTANARALVEAGAAWLLAEADATPDAVAGLMEKALGDPAGLAAAAAAARDMAQANAADLLADLIEGTAEAGRSSRAAGLAGGIAA